MIRLPVAYLVSGKENYLLLLIKLKKNIIKPKGAKR
jgi:hypothetical protein